MVVREGTTDVQSILYVKTSLISLNPTIFKTNVRLPPDDLVQKLREVVRTIILTENDVEESQTGSEQM